jgi:hypothetical protein
MKKSKTKKHKHASGLKSSSRFNPMVGLLVVAVTALVGVVALKASFAAQDATIAVKAKTSSGQVLSNVYFHMDSSNGSCAEPVNTTRTTDGGGWGSYTSCTSGATYCLDESDISHSTYTYIGYYAYAVSGSVGSSISGTCLTPGPGAFLEIDMTLTPTATLSFSANPTTITKGASTTLSWSSGNTTSCSASSGWSGAKATSGSQVVSPFLTTIYTLYCAGGYSQASATKTLTVTVNNPPPPPPPPPPATTPPPKTTTSPPPATTTKPKTTTSPTPPPPPAPAIVKATSGDTTPPSSPGELTVKANDDGTVSLSWAASTDNVGVTGYSVERSSGSSDWTYLTDSNASTSYKDSSVPSDGSEYSYRVRAVDTAGNQSEAAYADVAVKTTDSNTATSDHSIKAPAKKSSAGKTALKIGGTVLVLAAIGGGIVTFLKWRAARALAIDDQIRNTTVENAIHTVEPTAPHQAESLKEMVMHDQGPPAPKE